MKTLGEIQQLEELYQYRWGKSVNYTIIPKGITQEKLIKTLKRAVDTGESILVAYSKIK